MSLKADIEKYPNLWSKELVAVIEDLKKGKMGAKRKLRKFVNKEISEHYYNELIERYQGIKHEKKNWHTPIYGIPLNGNTLFIALYILAFIAASCVLSDALSIHKNNIWVNCSLGFFILSGFLYHYSKATDIEDKDRKIAELNQRIHTLEDSSKSDKIVIELLEKELEKAQGNNNG